MSESYLKLTRTKFGTILYSFLDIKLRPMSIEGGNLLSFGVMTLILPSMVCNWSKGILKISAANLSEKKISAFVDSILTISPNFDELYFGY